MALFRSGWDAKNIPTPKLWPSDSDDSDAMTFQSHWASSYRFMLDLLVDTSAAIVKGAILEVAEGVVVKSFAARRKLSLNLDMKLIYLVYVPRRKLTTK